MVGNIYEVNEYRISPESYSGNIPKSIFEKLKEISIDSID